MKRLAFVIMLIFSCTVVWPDALAFAQQPDEPPRKAKRLSRGKAKGAQQIYKRLLPSTCWVLNRPAEDPENFSMGTGWVCDFERRLVVTNDHVIDDQDTFDIYFPVMEKGKAIVDPDRYLEEFKPIKAVAIDRDTSRDLALLQLESLPKSAKAISIAPKLPTPGERVYSVAGWPEGSQGLWVFSVGTVRLSYRRSHANGAIAGVIETDMPFNRGNSGGPMVNAAGELVAVVEGFNRNARLVSMSIDCREVRDYLKECDSLVAPKDADAYFERGNRRHNEGRTEYAMQDYSQALKLNPDHIAARLNRGWLLYEDEDYQTAIRDFSDVIKLDPSNAAAYSGRGASRREAGDYQHAIDDLSEAIQLEPTNAEFYFKRARTHKKMEDWGTALRDVQRAIKYDDENPEFWMLCGQMHRMQKDYDQAIEALSKAFRLSPGDFRFVYETGYVQMEAENYEKAVSLFGIAIQLNDKIPQSYNNRGLCLNELDRYREALGDFQQAIELRPNKGLYYKHAGDTFRWMKQYENAVLFYDKAIKLDGQDASFFRARARAHRALGNEAAAARDERRADALDP